MNANSSRPYRIGDAVVISNRRSRHRHKTGTVQSNQKAARFAGEIPYVLIEFTDGPAGVHYLFAVDEIELAPELKVDHRRSHG